MDKMNNLSFYFFFIMLIFLLPSKVKCFDIEEGSSICLYIIFIVFILALLGQYSIKKKGYNLVNEKIKISTKL